MSPAAKKKPDPNKLPGRSEDRDENGLRIRTEPEPEEREHDDEHDLSGDEDSG